MIYTHLGGRDLLLELERLRQWAERPTVNMLQIEPMSAPPDREVEGAIVRADGVNWDPGDGAGLYVWRAGAWRYLEGAGGGGGAPLVALPIIPVVPNAGDWISYLPMGLTTTQASAANRMDIAPFAPAHDLVVDRCSLHVSSGVAGQCCVVVFDSDALGRPTTLRAQSANGDTTSGGAVQMAISVTFEAGKQYWVGSWTSADPTLRRAQTQSAAVVEWTQAGSPAQRNLLRRTVTYGGTAPDWVYASGQSVAGRPSVVLMRIA